MPLNLMSERERERGNPDSLPFRETIIVIMGRQSINLLISLCVCQEVVCVFASERLQVCLVSLSVLFFCCYVFPGSGCFAFWCCPCFACITTRDYGECLCLPLLEIFGGLIPPITMSMRVSMRQRYGIRVSNL